MNIIIIGAGASGLFCAGFLAENGHNVSVIEHSNTVAKKILITGKGRCNVTNNTDEETILRNTKTNAKFLYSAIYQMPPAQVMKTFEDLGVKLKTERGRRVFPVSDKAMDIKIALEKHAKKANIIYDDVKELIFDGDKVVGVLLTGDKKLFADKVIVATGGLSYKQTGSTGDGYKFAKQAGHTVITPKPSLVPLCEEGDICKSMMGLSLKNVNLSIVYKNKEVFKEQGEMLFTHFGLSGPLVLSASCHIKDDDIKNHIALIDLKPALDKDTLYKRITRDFELFSNKKAMNCLDKLLAKSMIPQVLRKWGIDTQKQTNQITKQEKLLLVDILKGFSIKLRSKYKIDVAVITSGGVSTKEINPTTMQSKIKENLYFIGEVIDVDAYTGGYNLQIAFSTAYACSMGIIDGI